MATEEELKQAILDDAAAGIKRTTIDGNTVEMLTPEERQHAADKAAEEEARRSTNGGLQFRKINTYGGLGS